MLTAICFFISQRFWKAQRYLRRLACLQVLAANCPTILFWNPQQWPIRPEAARYFDDLQAVGILWHGPEEAAAKVMEVYSSPNEWWKSEPVQLARQRFVDHFARGRTNWPEDWAMLLKEELAIGQTRQT